MIDQATLYASNGLAPIPIIPQLKTPAVKWSQYFDHGPSQREVAAMFGGHTGGIGIICGRASDGLVVLDTDNPQRFAEVADLLEGLGINTWTVQRPPNGSDHDGGGHFYLRTPTAARTTKIGGLDVKSQGAYVLAPPSMHPAGGHYSFTHTAGIGIFTLPTMGTLAPMLTLEPAPATGEHWRLSRLAWRLLQGDSETVQRYASRSEAEAALCASLMQSGYTYPEAWDVFMRFEGPGKFRELYQKNPQNADRYLQLTWDKTRAWLDQHDGGGREIAERLQRWALNRAWPGRGGSSERAVYHAHLVIVKRCGKVVYQASARELAELAGVSWVTAAKANHRLVDAGLLELIEPATPSCANRWRLLEPECRIVTHSNNYTVVECKGMRQVEHGHDVFRWHGLNKSSAEILAVLAATGEPAKVAAIAEATGRHRSTVYRKLGEMFKLGMVEPVSRSTWQIVPGFDLDAIARELDTAGDGKRQRRRHVQDRRYHQMVLEWRREHG